MNIHDLYDAACLIKDVIEENIELKHRNKFLEDELMEWNKFSSKMIKDQYDQAGNVLKILLKNDNNKRSKSPTNP